MPSNKKAGKKTAGKGSGRPVAAQPPDPDRYEAALWNTVRNMMESFNRTLTPEGENPFSLEMVDWSAVHSFLIKEAIRAAGDTQDGPCLRNAASGFIRQALKKTLVRDPQAIARFAIEMVYDSMFRVHVQTLLNSTWVRQWLVSSDYQKIHCWPCTPDFGLPIPFVDFRRVIYETLPWELGHIEETNFVEPCVGTCTPYESLIDPMRPPFQAIRLASANLVFEDDSKCQKVLAIELGHNYGALALAMCLKTTIFTESMVFEHGDEPNMPSSFDAVVLGIPNAAAVEFVKRALSGDGPMTRRDTERFLNWPKTEQPTFIKELVQKAISLVSPGGSLAVIGDIESGANHLADAMIEETGKFLQLGVYLSGSGLLEKPVSIRYETKPRGIHGVLPPTDRMVSVWYRIM